MKYISMIGIITILLFAGCTQRTTDSDASTPDTSGFITSGIQNIYSGGELNSFTLISGFYNTLIISGNYFVDNGFFAINIPKELTTREYDGRMDTLNNIYFDDFLLTNTGGKQYFNSRIQVVSPTQSSLSEKQLCHKEYMDKFLSHTKITKIIQGHNIYIDYTTIKITNLDNIFWIKNEARICFVQSDKIYTLGIGGYSLEDTNAFVDFLYFY